MDFAEWTVTVGWQQLQGMLVNDGSGGAAYAPYLPESTDYTVEAEIQVVRVSEGFEGGAFGIFVRDGEALGQMSLNAYASGWAETRFMEEEISPDRPTNPDMNDVEIGDWHIYRLEVRGNTLRLSVDGTVLAEGSHNGLLQPASGNRVGVFADPGIQANVRSFKVIAQ
ncbi:MAG: hypothetical protein M3464_16865 [Chloroflexota bacterium]|nr:hypothetical protein [Chloroflexota bacterium]